MMEESPLCQLVSDMSTPQQPDFTLRVDNSAEFAAGDLAKRESRASGRFAKKGEKRNNRAEEAVKQTVNAESDEYITYSHSEGLSSEEEEEEAVDLKDNELNFINFMSQCLENIDEPAPVKVKEVTKSDESLGDFHVQQQSLDSGSHEEPKNEILLDQPRDKPVHEAMAHASSSPDRSTDEMPKVIDEPPDSIGQCDTDDDYSQPNRQQSDLAISNQDMQAVSTQDMQAETVDEESRNASETSLVRIRSNIVRKVRYM